MAFGLAGGLTFAYLPFVKLGGMPLIAYRTMPRAIIKGLQKNIGIKMKLEKFSKPQRGTARLDELLEEGKIVGAQSSVFWLPYLSTAKRREPTRSATRSLNIPSKPKRRPWRRHVLSKG